MEHKLTSSNRIKELDALRGMAALMVLLFHYNLLLVEKSLPILKLGVTGVDLFFMISGFVIYMSLTKINNGVDFIINRLSRLYPTYWICVSITFLFFVFKDDGGINLHNFIRYISNMTMFQFYIGSKNIDESYWTMIVEMIFYMGILCVFQLKILKWLNIIGLSLAAIAVILTQYFYQIRIVEKLIYYIPLLQFIALFFAGTVLYKIYTEPKKLLSKYAILIACIICQILLFQFSGRSRYIISQSQYAMMLMIYFTLFILFVNHKLKFVVSKITLFLGEISFPLYLIHQYISTEVIIPFLTKHLYINFWVAALLITLPIVVLLAAIITYYIEVPSVKWMKRKLHLLKNSFYPSLSHQNKIV